MMPVIPHLINECLNKIGNKNNIKWPEVNKELIKSNNLNIAVQINGKKRTIIEIKRDTEEKEVLEKINKNELINKYIENKRIIKIIYVKNKILNIIVTS